MRTPSRLLVTVLATGIVFSTAFAAAASLDVSAGSLGAGSSAVTSCDSNGVTTTYGTTFSASLAGYKVTTVSVNDIATPACAGKTMKVTLLDGSDDALAEVTVALGTPVASPTNVDFSNVNVRASDVHKVAVVLYG